MRPCLLFERPFATCAAPSIVTGLFGMKIFSLLIAAAIATPLLAQGATPPLMPDLPHTKTVLDALLKAGPVMVPLFLLSIFSVMLVIVYLMTIRRGAVVSSGDVATAGELLRKGDSLGLLAVSN